MTISGGPLVADSVPPSLAEILMIKIIGAIIIQPIAQRIDNIGQLNILQMIDLIY